MYSKCKCCVSIVAKQQNDNRGAVFQKLVAEVKKGTGSGKKIKAGSFVIRNNEVREVDRSAFGKWPDPLSEMVDLTVEGDPYVPANIVHRLDGRACVGLCSKIHQVDVVADMVEFKVRAIAKNREGSAVSVIRSIEADGPCCVIRWHWEMMNRIRLGGSDYTGQLNKGCRLYYANQSAQGAKRERERLQKFVRDRKLCASSSEIPLSGPPTKASRCQPPRSARKRKSYVGPDYSEYDMEQSVAYVLPAPKKKKKRKGRTPGYKRGPYKKRVKR